MFGVDNRVSDGNGYTGCFLIKVRIHGDQKCLLCRILCYSKHCPILKSSCASAERTSIVALRFELRQVSVLYLRKQIHDELPYTETDCAASRGLSAIIATVSK